MGGKALNKYGVQTERKNTLEFLAIGQLIQTKIANDFPYLETSVVKCYHTKTDHGDLDLLIKVPYDANINWSAYIQVAFNPRAINSNGGVCSFDYKNFQVDFIPIIESKWDTAKVYYSYDPLGNIMGKTFHKFGLSYGWDGLFYKFRNFNGRNSNDILLTNDARKIFEFGGYDYDRYLQGFETLEEIFKFCIDSKYFDTEIFQMENLKAIDKKRNRKRGSYHIFLNYMKDSGITTRYEFDRDKESYLPMITESFPDSNIKEKLHMLNMIDTRNKVIAQKFNGDIVMSWLPELQGKELGNAIGKFKNHLGDNYDDFILSSSYEAIHNYFIDVYNDDK